MRIILFYPSLLADWSHGNAHFVRGYATELQERGHQVIVYEPAKDWSSGDPEKGSGTASITQFPTCFPGLPSVSYDSREINLTQALTGADLVIVHELTERTLVARIGRHRQRMQSFGLLFHDTHHRALTDPETMALYDLSHYDGVLARGDAIRQIYLEQGWASQAWTWHEAADTRIFYPRRRAGLDGDVVWMGNWCQQERAEQLHEFLLQPVQDSGIKAGAYGTRYPEAARIALAHTGIEYGGWLPFFRTPEVLARFCVTLHLPRRPYVHSLPGIPTIRLFEGLACGIPVVSSTWEDREGLFKEGDFLIARSGQEMKKHLCDLLNDREFARATAAAGRRTVLARHTCAHRVDQLLDICARHIELANYNHFSAMEGRSG
jgi:spore maturation protein CgeB